uniref:DUF1534 domain-containing protein n=1 Tax=Steinernema glaseri TaxID=37863 RepID=A0A1I7YJU2_9BILA
MKCQTNIRRGAGTHELHSERPGGHRRRARLQSARRTLALLPDDGDAHRLAYRNPGVFGHHRRPGCGHPPEPP